MSELSKAERIAAARRSLAAARAANPEAVSRFEARMARLAAAAKREQERLQVRVFGMELEALAVRRPAGMSRAEWKVQKPKLRAEAARAKSLRAKWSHKQGTPETLEHASRTHQGAIAQLHANGVLNIEQVEWVAQIANVHRSIEADVGMAIASLEARVDASRSARHLVGESLMRVRMHRAYTLWREQLPSPKPLVLDMIVGDPIGYTVCARRYGVHNRKAKRLLLDAINSWPGSVDLAFREVTAKRFGPSRAAF